MGLHLILPCSQNHLGPLAPPPPVLCSWSLLSYGVLAKSLRFPFPGPQFPNVGKSSQDESRPLSPHSQNLRLSSKVVFLFIFCIFVCFFFLKTGSLPVIQQAVPELTMRPRLILASASECWNSRYAPPCLAWPSLEVHINYAPHISLGGLLPSGTGQP